MIPAEIAAHDGEFVVVETENDWYLGTVRLDIENQQLTVYSGLTGRPPVIPLDDVQDIVRAHKHPAIAAA